MKKTFLSLAFVLSISISASFAAESKPVVSESKTSTTPLVEKSTPIKNQLLNKAKQEDYIIECYGLSCDTVCVAFPASWGPSSPAESVESWEALDDILCH